MELSPEIVTIGRRKEARARVRMRPGTGQVVVNGRPLDEYLARETLVVVALEPFTLTDTRGKYDLRVRCNGGGKSGQAGAIRLGIARALAKTDTAMARLLHQNGMLRRDARCVERKKYGQPGARKRFQFSKR